MELESLSTEQKNDSYSFHHTKKPGLILEKHEEKHEIDEEYHEHYVPIYKKRVNNLNKIR